MSRQYRIIRSQWHPKSLDVFEHTVEEAMADGWSPLGGVSITSDHTSSPAEYIYAQALVKEIP